ncbi:MAG: MBG domain-containing protein [Christensenellaceae bacterium]|nr:MBG domain-containing protein [Christensenellaceae bacterium]
MSFNVEFVPFNPQLKLDGSPLMTDEILEYCSKYSYYLSFYEGTTFTGGNGNHALNYASATYNITLVINKALTTVEINEPFELVYTGSAQTPEFTTSPEYLKVVESYELRNSNGIYTNTSAPIVAGDYRVTYYIDDANYKSEIMTATFTLAKQKITIMPNEDQLVPTVNNSITAPITDDQMTYNQYLSSKYGRLTTPNVIITEAVTGGITYSYSYKKMRTQDGSTIESEYSSPVTLLLANSLMDSGVYLLKIIVDATNYAGDCTIMVYLAPANANESLEAAYFTYAFPDVKSTYYVYNIGASSPVSISYDTTIGHLEYGQTIADVSKNNQIFSNFSTSGVQYSYLSGKTIVLGRFRISTEQEIAELNGITLDNRNGISILPVRYEQNNSGVVIPYNAYIIWEAGEYIEDVFVLNENFVSLKKSISLYVARATPVFDNINFDPLVYGSQLVSYHYGTPYTAGNNSDITGISQYNLQTYEYVLTPENPEYIAETGDNSVTYVFTPTENYNLRYREITFIASITVTQKKAEVIIAENIGSQFGDYYVDPEASTNPFGLKLKYEFFNDDAPITIGPDTPVGSYTVKVSINETNYYGDATATYTVSKALLVWNVQPLTVSGEIRYGVKIADIQLTTGGSLKTREGTYVLPGLFTCISIEGLDPNDYIPSGRHDVLVEYEPGMTVSNGFDERYEVGRLTVTIDILKNTPDIIIEDLNKTYNTKSQSATVKFSGLVSDYTIQYQISYVNKANGNIFDNGDSPIESGTYTLNVVINDLEYQGSATVDFIISKATTYITSRSYVFGYDGASHAFVFDSSVVGLNFILTYLSNSQVSTVVAPSMVGKYQVNIQLAEGNVEANYKIDGTGNYPLYIVPIVNGIKSEDLYQFYGNTFPITASFTYQSINPEIIYKNTKNIEYNDESFVNATADLYYLSFNISINGLEGTVIAGRQSDISNDFYSQVVIPELSSDPFYLYDTEVVQYVNTLFIAVNKSTVKIILDDSYETTYTGQDFNPNSLGIYTELQLYQPKLIFTYTLGDTSTEETTTVKNAGTYKLIIKVSDDNYTGEANSKLIINKADPMAREAPTLAGKYSYGDNPSLIEFKNDGWVIFNGQSISGTWSVATQNFDKETVGLHNDVLFKFVPDDKSLNEAYIYGTINISRKDISGDLAYEQADLEQEYNRDNHTVRAYILNKSAEYLAVDKNLQLTVSYNSASYAPVDCGAYKISIYVNSTYYEGSIGTNGSIVMNVVPATPSLILPTISAIKVGDELSTAKITGGLAYIGDTIHTVDGNFYFNNPKERPSVLNERPFSMLFAPTDFNNYTTPMFTVYVLVVPSEQSLYDYSYGTVSVAPFTYGIPLSSIKPSIVRDTEDIPGTIEWVDPMLLIKNGDTPEYRFIPSKTEQNSDNRYYYDVYPIITAKVDPVTINNATFKLSELSYGIVYVGERLSEVRLYFTPLNSETNSPIDDFSVSLMVGSSNISLDTVIDSTHLANPASLNVKITLSKNYYTTAIFDITDIRVRNLLAEINFNTSVKTKNYDGNPLSGLALLSTVGLSVTDTSFEQKLDKYVINSILLDGVLVDQVLSAGSYIVSVTYDDGVHYGNTTFTFEVLKRDISNAIKLPSGSNEISFEYGSSKDTFDLIFSEVIQEQQFNYNEDDILPYISFSYYDGNNGITYGPTSPKNAGVYTVTVSISISCPMFTGSRPFIYTITRKEINLYFPSASGYSFQYGEIISIIPVIDVTDAGDYYLTFNDSQITPENAGTYQVKAHLDGKNFYGTSSSVVLSIEKAKLLVTEYPTITGLIFGQNLGSATIVGGTCVNSRTGQVATGSFYFMDPTIIGFTAGTNNRVYLKYIYNDNYEVLENIEVDVTVGKATANITVTSQNAIYTAGEVRPIVNSDTAYPVVYEMYFTQGNVQVTPVNAGTYTVRITINDDNYQGEISNLTFTIVPVKAYKVIEPTPSTITYGSSLSYSAFFGGSAWYFESNPTSGSFVYASPALVPGTNELKEKGVGNVVGTYIVAYKFVPNDTLNYLEWTGDIIITVTKANASIFVSNYNFTYGDTITTPKFTTDPGGITVINSEFENASFEGSTPDAGVYNFRAYIDNEYYTGEAVYNIVVAKKAIEFKFVNENSNQVDKYITQYNVPLKAQILIDADSIFATGEGIASILDMLKYNVIYTYIQKDVSNPEVKFVSPTLVGTYYVSVSLSNNNYYIRAEDSTIDYEIERATITKIEFDANSISNQVYGSVSYPLVTIEPAGVPYELRFDDQPYLPTTVGDHNVVLIISDSNYVPISKQNRFRILPKPITIEDIKVLNKAFDGTSNLTITGTLKGLLQNDEVYLTITARTKDGATEVGRHDVEIVSWELKGQHAGNYTISVIPVYTSQITITKQTVDDSSGEGYITSSEGFSPNVTLVIKNVTSSADPSNIFTAILGQKAIVKSVALKENGNNMVLSERVKFYILLPENYRNSSDLEFIGTGALEGEMLNFVREGDYITFYADRSGEIVIIAHDFPYWLIIVGGALLLIVSLFVFIKVMPAKRRLYVTRRFRKEYQRRAYVTNVRAARAEKERLRLEEQKYNGHYD